MVFNNINNDSKRKSISINGKEIPLNIEKENSFASNFEGIFGTFYKNNKFRQIRSTKNRLEC